MPYVISILYLIIFIFCAFLVSEYFFTTDRALVKLVFSLAFGLIGLMWFPALFALAFEFNMTAIYTSLGFSVITGVIFYALKRRKANLELRRRGNHSHCSDVTNIHDHTASGTFNHSTLFIRIKNAVKSEKTALIVIAPFFAVTMFLLHTHVLESNASGGLDCGQSTWGDMSMHLSFITSLSFQKTFPPNYNLIAGNIPLGYPFLCDSISSVFFSITGDHRFSYLLPMFVAILAVFSAVFLFFDTWIVKKTKSALATTLFLLGGGFGFAYFLDLTREDIGNVTRIFTGFYTTPTNFTEKNILWVNVIADMLIPQRSTLFGWAVLIPCLYLLYRAAFQGEKRLFVPLGVMAGALPLVNTHSFLALAALSLVYLIRACVTEVSHAKTGGFHPPSSFHMPLFPIAFKRLSPWIAYAVIAAALALPQLIGFTFKQATGENFLRLHFNWVNNKDGYLWFYIKNIGLPYLLVIPAFLHADRDSKWLYCGGLFLLTIAELFLFQPNPYDNNKLIFIWYLLNCGIVANFLIDVYSRLRDIKGIKSLAAITLVCLNLSGVLTLGREAVSNFTLFARHHVEAAAFIIDNTPPDALFLTANNHNNTVASLTGRNIFIGSGSFLYFHGIGTWDKEIALRNMLEAPDMDELNRNGIDYVYISDYERVGYVIDYLFFDENLKKIYNSDGVIIYKVE